MDLQFFVTFPCLLLTFIKGHLQLYILLPEGNSSLKFSLNFSFSRFDISFVLLFLHYTPIVLLGLVGSDTLQFLFVRLVLSSIWSTFFVFHIFHCAFYSSLSYHECLWFQCSCIIKLFEMCKSPSSLNVLLCNVRYTLQCEVKSFYCDFRDVPDSSTVIFYLRFSPISWVVLKCVATALRTEELL